MEVDTRFNGSKRQMILVPANKIEEQIIKLFSRDAKTATIKSYGDKQEGIVFEIWEAPSHEAENQGLVSPNKGVDSLHKGSQAGHSASLGPTSSIE